MQEDNIKEINKVLDDVVAVQGKKKPGRPRKQIEAIRIEVNGIIHNPTNNGNVVELVYRNPLLFAKLMRLYKQYEVSEIEMIFTKDGIKISTIDHIQKSNIYATIDGQAMDSYYCKQPLRVCITRVNLEHILSSLNKNHTRITIVFREDDYRSIMHVEIKDNEYNNEDRYEIEIVYKAEEPAGDGTQYDDSNYPIKFRMSSQYFKSKITQIKKLSNVFTIEKGGNDNLQITLGKISNVSWVGIYNDKNKIDLQSTIAENDALSVSVYINYIKPFSNSNIGDDVYISAHKTEKISLTTMLDKVDTKIGYACIIKIFTEIIGNNQ